MKILVAFLLLLGVCCSPKENDSKSQSDTTKTLERVPRDSAKAFFQSVATSSSNGISNREVFQSQVKLLSLTVFSAILGFALRLKNEKEKHWALGLACLFSLMLFGMDTYLLDLNNRQIVFMTDLNQNVTVRWQSLSDDTVDTIYKKTIEGLPDSPPW